MGVLKVRWSYSTMNIATFSHFFLIIISSGSILFCSSIMAITLNSVVSSSLWLVIQLIMLSTRLTITIWFTSTKSICLWDFYISTNWWKISTDCWPSTNNLNLFIFNRWFLPCSVIFLEYYDALLKLLFVVVVVVWHP